MEESHGSIIYLETCREVGPYRVVWEQETVTHELGHATGADHGDGGLMGDEEGGSGDSDFTDISLDKIRSKVW